MMKMMGKVKEMQAKMKEAQENLAFIKETGEAGGGMVKAVVNGKKEVVSIEIDESLMNAADKEMAQDLTVAASNHAMAKADISAKLHLTFGGLDEYSSIIQLKKSALKLRMQ